MKKMKVRKNIRTNRNNENGLIRSKKRKYLEESERQSEMNSEMNVEELDQIETFEERQKNGCGSLYLHQDELPALIKILAELWYEHEFEHGAENGRFRILVSPDLDYEDGFYLSKQKIL